MRAARTPFGLACAIALLACASPHRIEPEELPPDPVAVQYHTPEEGRRRADRLRALRGEESGEREGVMRLGDLAEWLRDPDAVGALLGRAALVDPRRGTARTLEGLPRGARPQAWSPDRRTLLFASPWLGDVQLFSLKLASGEVRRLTGGAGHPMGCWLPDGRLVAVERSGRGAGARARLVVQRGPGAWSPLTEGPVDLDPACSPDGRWVAYVAPEAGRVVIRVVPAGGGAPRTVAAGADPAFTPDAAWIVYSARSSRGWRLRRMRPDGAGKLPVGDGGRGEERQPAVSPDGRFVAYVLELDEQEWLRVRRLGGRGDRPLLEQGTASGPVW